MSNAKFRVVAWNCHGATSGSVAFWKYFLDQDADVALLQEVISIPDNILSIYNAELARR
jgi:hypothetical protein